MHRAFVDEAAVFCLPVLAGERLVARRPRADGSRRGVRARPRRGAAQPRPARPDEPRARGAERPGAAARRPGVGDDRLERRGPRAGDLLVRVVPVEEALRMFTINGAWVGKEEQLKGTIEAGKFADLVVLDRDPYKEPQQIKDFKVAMTLVEGKIVYEN